LQFVGKFIGDWADYTAIAKPQFPLTELDRNIKSKALDRKNNMCILMIGIIDG
jgi:hypothetical protein